MIPLGCQKLYETVRYGPLVGFRAGRPLPNFHLSGSYENPNVRKEPPRSGRMLVLVSGVYHRHWLLSVAGVGLADLLMSGEWSMLPMLLMPEFNL